MIKRHKLVEVPVRVIVLAVQNFYQIERRQHRWLHNFLGVEVNGAVTRALSRAGAVDKMLPHVAKKLHMLASPHHVTLYKAYCVKRGLGCQT